jgi:ABC-type phosphate transport system substrate-binding protein
MAVRNQAAEVEMRRLWLLMVLTTLVGGFTRPVAADGFVVVTHSGVQGTTISLETLRAIYLKEVIQWGDHTSIRPVDQSSHSPIRQAFSERVLGRSLGQLQLFWRNRLAVDRVMPPPIKPSDAEVLAFVARNKGAIGYVSAGAQLPPDVKAVRLTD